MNAVYAILTPLERQVSIEKAANGLISVLLGTHHCPEHLVDWIKYRRRHIYLKSTLCGDHLIVFPSLLHVLLANYIRPSHSIPFV